MKNNNKNPGWKNSKGIYDRYKGENLYWRKSQIWIINEYPHQENLSEAWWGKALVKTRDDTSALRKKKKKEKQKKEEERKQENNFFVLTSFFCRYQ